MSLNPDTVSVILIHYKAENLIVQAIKSVLNFSGLEQKDIEFIVIDNSQNFPQEKLTELNCHFKLINPGYNSGFARAVNMGLKATSNEFVCLMNQDASLFITDTFKKLIKEIKNLPKKTVVGCNLQDENGNHQQSVWIDDPDIKREWKSGPINCKLDPTWQEKMKSKKKQAHTNNGFVHRINGAFLVFQKPKIMAEIFFDEDFFLYGEDIEWALRIKRTGWLFYHISNVQIQHLGSASSNNLRIKLNQITVSDWLVMKKLNGNLYVMSLFCLLIFNKSIDFILVYFAKFRSKISQLELNSSISEIKNTKGLIVKYGLLILFKKSFSFEKAFLINLYDDVYQKNK
jgi:GT2 family glycosyltransferase